MTKELANNYSDSSMNKIKSLEIFSNEDLEILNNMSGELQRVFKVRQVFRTETEMKYSVLDDVNFPTIASKYWQSVREQHVMFQNLVNACFDYEDMVADLELLKLDYAEQEQKTQRGKIKARKLQSKIKRMEFGMADMVIVANDYVREIKSWENLKNQLREMDNTFDINDVNTDQINTLQQKWQKELEIAQTFNQDSLGKNALTGINTIKNNVLGKKGKELE